VQQVEASVGERHASASRAIGAHPLDQLIA
jgi:hypothetical protein